MVQKGVKTLVKKCFSPIQIADIHHLLVNLQIIVKRVTDFRVLQEEFIFTDDDAVIFEYTA